MDDPKIPSKKELLEHFERIGRFGVAPTTIAEVVDMEPTPVYRATASGELPSFTVGKQRKRVSPEDAAAWLHEYLVRSQGGVAA